MPTDKYKEADLLLRIFKIYSSDSMVDAFTWFFKDFNAKNLDDFQTQYPLGSEERKRFYKIGNFFDLLGAFVERDYLPEELVLDFCPDDVKSFWKNTKTIIFQMRKKWNDPTLYAGLEHLNEKIDRGRVSRETERDSLHFAEH
jgi:hypothetical protein